MSGPADRGRISGGSGRYRRSAATPAAATVMCMSASAIAPVQPRPARPMSRSGTSDTSTTAGTSTRITPDGLLARDRTSDQATAASSRPTMPKEM